MDVTHKTPVAILISGRGTNMMALVKAAQSGQLDADIRLVLSNKADAPGLQFAKQMNIPTKVLSHRDFPDRESFDKALVEAVEASGAQVVVLAGFMRVLTSTFLSKFPNRVLNIHPALLPSFPGMHAQRQAIEYGVKIAGCTVHIVDEGTDTGPILAQAALEVLEDDDENSLSARILELENRLYPSALQTFIAAKAAKSLATKKE